MRNFSGGRSYIQINPQDCLNEPGSQLVCFPVRRFSDFMSLSNDQTSQARGARTIWEGPDEALTGVGVTSARRGICPWPPHSDSALQAHSSLLFSAFAQGSRATKELLVHTPLY